MNIYEVEQKTPRLLERQTEVWEDSVRATHAFLTNAGGKAYKGVCSAGGGILPAHGIPALQADGPR